ncbi:MFS transporter [Rhodococcus sp. Z13]|uniref:MFS transporter n=1 Tax=Rhodococcus sacchari TaxID=2962047 RepID=A0ACD4DL37_9NOCA|nr:MFS transporter [Rhodococcus sp. Z13]UYP20769.1 MFS transporter [Rhodococcus sp. Z13]
MSTGTTGTRPTPDLRTTVLGLLALLLVAACLRPAITGVGPLLDGIGADTGLGSTGLGLLGAVPLLCFAGVSPWIHRPAVRFGVHRTVLVAMLVLTAGIVLRSVPGTPWLWLGTVAIGCGIGVGNVLLPAVVKRDYADRLATVTGVYSSVTTGAAGLGSGVAVPLAVATGDWRLALAAWALVSLLAAGVWAWRGRLVPTPPVPVPTAGAPAERSMWRSPLAWQVTAFMGLQSTTFYLLVTWLPSIEQALGVDRVAAGWHLSLYQVIGIGSGLAATAAMGRRRRHSALIAGNAAALAVAMGGMLVAPGAVLLWVLLAGVSSGASFVLALSLFGLRTRTVAQTARLSGMAQAVGYLLAATGPFAAGVLVDLTGSWTPALLLVAACAIAMAIVGAFAGRDRYTHGVASR